MAYFPVSSFFAPYFAFTVYGYAASDPEYDKGTGSI